MVFESPVHHSHLLLPPNWIWLSLEAATRGHGMLEGPAMLGLSQHQFQEPPLLLLAAPLRPFFLAMPQHLRDLSSPTRDRTWAMAVEVPSPNHWTAREFPCPFWPWSALC